VVEDPQTTVQSGDKAGPGIDVDEELALSRLQLQLFGRAAMPTTVGRYRVLDAIGSGGFGVVYRAEDPELQRIVAIKVIGAGVRNTGSEEHQRRLMREARAIAAINHPNVVEVFDVGAIDSATDRGVFIAMEFIDGPDLRAWLAQGAHPWSEVLEVFKAAGEGVAEAHAKGLTHRDFKPSNVLLGMDGRPRVVDFGLALSLDPDELSDPGVGPPSGSVGDEDEDEDEDEAEEHEQPGETTRAARLTRTGTVLGTPAYMAPEQLSARPGPAADQFSFCVALCEALCGRRPDWCEDKFRNRHGARSALETLAGEPPDPRLLRPVLHRGLMFEPEDRYPSMRALLDDIQRRMRNRRLGWGGAAVGFVLAGAGFATAAVRTDVPDPCRDAKQQLPWGDSQRRHLVDELSTAGVADVEGVAQRLDAYASAWVRGYESACRERDVLSPVQARAFDQRMACLSARRRDLGAIIDVLLDVDEAGRAVEAVATLQPVSLCAEPAAGRGPAPPRELAPQVEAIRAQVARAEAREWLGDFAGAEREASTALASAREIGFDPAVAEALVRLGALTAARSRHEEAEALYTEAFSVATASGADRAALDAALGMLVSVSGYELDFERGERWRRNGHALLDRGVGDTSQRARFAYVEGLIHLKKGEFDRGREYVQRAVDLQRSVEGADPFSLSHFEVGLASLKIREEPEEAAEELRIAADRIEALLGPDDARLGLPLAKRAIALRRIGRLEEGLAEAERARKIVESTIRGELRQRSSVYTTIGLLHFDAGNLDAAREALERADELASHVGGQRISSVAKFGLARVHARRGQCELARTELSTALPDAELTDSLSDVDVQAAQAEVEKCRPKP
jgi:tetratricopeptide (TPR) repeat protein